MRFFYYFRFVLVEKSRLPSRNEFCARNVSDYCMKPLLMNKQYKIAIYIFTVCQCIMFMFFCLFTVGLNPNKPNILNIHYCTLSFVILNIFLLFYYNYFTPTAKKLKLFLSVLCLLCLFINFGINCFLLWQIIIEGMDGGIFTIIFLTLFSLIILYIVKIIIKNTESNNR